MKIDQCKLVKIDTIEPMRLYETERELKDKLQQQFDAGFHVVGFVNILEETYMVVITPETEDVEEV